MKIEEASFLYAKQAGLSDERSAELRKRKRGC